MFIALATIVNALAVAWAARRLAGAPVGWGRAFVVSLLAGWLISPVFGFVAQAGQLPGLAVPATVTDPDKVGIFLVAALLGAWMLAGEVAVLAVLEVFIPTGTFPDMLTWVRDLPAQLRRNRRLSSILLIIARHGLGGMVRRRPGHRDLPHAAIAAQVRDALIDGGVTFIKLGQTLATRADLLPPAYVAELSQLHSEVPAEPWETVHAALTAELGRPVEEVFASVDQAALAAASVAQVHAATLPDGTEVVLKIQRPGARRDALADLDIIIRLADQMERMTSWGKRIGARELAAGFAASLREELDYGIEVANMDAIARTSAGSVSVPRVWRHLCTPRLIVMERVAGQPLSRAHEQLATLTGQQRSDLAGQLFDSVLRQMITGGVFHADLHPGNIVLTRASTGDASEPGADRPAGPASRPGEPENPAYRMTLLDFGSVGRLGRASRDSIGLLLAAFERQDDIAAADALIELLGRPEGLDDRMFERDLGLTMLRAGGSARLFTDLLELVLSRGFTVPPQVAAAFRAMATLEGSLRSLDPHFDLVDAARSRAGSLMAELLSPGQLRTRLEGQLATVIPGLLRLPRRIDRIAGDLQSGELTINVRSMADGNDRAFVTAALREAGNALLACALAIAGVILMIGQGGPALVGIISVHSFLGATLLLFGFVLGARLLVAEFSGRQALPRRGAMSP